MLWSKSEKLQYLKSFSFPREICKEGQIQNFYCPIINKRDGGVLIYIYKRLKCNLLSCCYRPPNGDSENLNMFLQKNIIKKSVSEKKINYTIGDFNMNCLKYHENAETKYFYDNIFENGVIPIINRPTGFQNIRQVLLIIFQRQTSLAILWKKV